MASGSITFVIKSSFEHVHLVGVSLNRICTVAGFDEGNAYQVELAVVEGINNCIKHAYQNEPQHKVQIDVTVSDDSIIITITDSGLPFQPADALGPDFDHHQLDDLPEGGMGVFLFHQVMDQVQFTQRENFNVLTMEKRIHR